MRPPIIDVQNLINQRSDASKLQKFFLKHYQLDIVPITPVSCTVPCIEMFQRACEPGKPPLIELKPRFLAHITHDIPANQTWSPVGII